MSNTVNIFPINDIEEHQMDGKCKCNPKVICQILNEEEYAYIIVHNSFDRREIQEELIKAICEN